MTAAKIGRSMKKCEIVHDGAGAPGGAGGAPIVPCSGVTLPPGPRPQQPVDDDAVVGGDAAADDAQDCRR